MPAHVDQSSGRHSRKVQRGAQRQSSRQTRPSRAVSLQLWRWRRGSSRCVRSSLHSYQADASVYSQWEVRREDSAKGKGKADQSTVFDTPTHKSSTATTSQPAENISNREATGSSPSPHGKAPAARFEFAEPAPFKPFTPPVFESPSRPIVKYTPTKSTQDESTSSTAAPVSKAADTPKFSLTPASPAPKPQDESLDPSFKRAPLQPSKVDTNKIYYSAKDQALRTDKSALPFFTFDLPPGAVQRTPDSEQTKAAKKLALESPIATFHFTITDVDSTIPPAKAVEAPVQETAKTNVGWTCGLCGLKNPATALEKCQICEEPRTSSTSKPAPAATAAEKPKSSTTDGPWQCGLCGLKNPADATEKCTICEEPRK